MKSSHKGAGGNGVLANGMASSGGGAHGVAFGNLPLAMQRMAMGKGKGGKGAYVCPPAIEAPGGSGLGFGRPSVRDCSSKITQVRKCPLGSKIHFLGYLHNRFEAYFGQKGAANVRLLTNVYRKQVLNGLLSRNG